MHFTKLVVLLAAFLLAAYQAHGAQQFFGHQMFEQQPMAVIRISMDDSDNNNDDMSIAEPSFDDVPSMFDVPPPSMPPAFFPPDIFSSLFRNLFDEGMDSSSDEPTIVRMTITSSDDSDDAQDEPEADNPLARFSSVFQRMASLIEDVRMRSMDGMQDQTDVSMPVHRDCPLLRACADDIDQYCSSERLSQIAGALSICLMQHRTEVSEECGAALDKRMPDDADEEEQPMEEEDQDPNEAHVTVVEVGNDDAPADMEEPEEAQEMEPEMVEPEIVEAQPEQQEAPTPDRPCAFDVEQFCSAEKANMDKSGLVAVMACLHRHKDELSTVCLDAVNPTPAFHCAEDAERLCPTIHGRHNIARCLHQNAADVSQECKDAAHRHGVENGQKMRFTTMSTSSSTDQPEHNSAEAQSQPTATSESEEEMPSHVLPLAIAGGGFVLIVSLVAVVVSYRRRRARAEELPITITLSNPTQSAVDLSAVPVHYSPRAQDRL